MHYGSSFVDLIVWNVVVQTKLKMDISKESYRILKYKIYKKCVHVASFISHADPNGP